GNGHGREAYQILQTMLATFADAGSVHQPGNDLKEPAYDSVCVLCRTNGELLQVASQLATQGIPYFIRPRSTEYALPAWVGRVLGTCQQTRLVLPEFEDRWRKLVGDVVPLDPA